MPNYTQALCFAVIVALVSPTNASAAAPQACCRWDPITPLNCLMYCPGGDVANPGPLRARSGNSESKTQGPTSVKGGVKKESLRNDPQVAK